MRIITKGVTRIIIVFDTFVIKIPKFYHNWCHFLRGLIGNMEEGRTWRWNSDVYSKGTEHLLCPVIWTSWGGWLLIMRRAETFTEKQWDLMEVDISEHRKHFCGDDTISNYGKLEGRIVKIDYADLDNHWGEDFEEEYRNI